ncbi:ABR140Cp [Eremothecium gossypii ATCC 10895]|uniref:Glutamyl-tRNA(Gln) amidotransferase subunit A, mitochondrial n=1 Tax=Eremothecium gossypii (strain ATCC 10895 / CBS 109.51 / FGSC 9923 / NRRL Y-1056) TaxID=284811 RepID=GATA_EREGS|nr:ABR140Cp [Eremothecium gossypii ATCC 10895]Q75D84.2 RecName: Full=Glutamyl-tRNA(Gln) amidotransferase subunit A, mitochondrial; Short=Glu-AdT subunit A [Eremothecium gossypii ATCC 10895]AAS50911.2 ABR140Cp [Eremothecium gossypii ATCC 10895]AEY95200.1 FABR140Cp [Eremothecium gossypii FDAG1]
MKRALERLRQLPRANERFNIFNSVNLSAAQQVMPSEKPLGNLVVGIKDNIVTKKLPTTCSSGVLAGYMSPYDATVVELLDEAGAVTAGKTNMDEFGMGSGGIHSFFGPTLNPAFPERPTVAGGSSSGSAAAVAAGVVDFALGTDTGGSVRMPAAYTSTVGFKPSYGRVSRHGVIAYAQSLDTVGIGARDVGLVRRVFEVLDRHDPKDPTSLPDELRQQAAALRREKKHLKIGIPAELLHGSVAAEIRERLLVVLDKLQAQGHELYPVSVPAVKNSLLVYYMLAPAEAASNLARYDGIRYGCRDEDLDMSDEVLFAPTRGKFGKEVKNRIVLGNYNLCSGAFKNNYMKAQKLRVELINQFDSIFAFENICTGNKPNPAGVDVLLSLTCMAPPPSLEAFTSKENKSPVNSYINDVFTVPMSLAGLPCISVPLAGMKGVGIQLTAQFADDYGLLDAAEDVMQEQLN